MNEAVEKCIHHCRSHQSLVANNYKGKSIKHQWCDYKLEGIHSCVPSNNDNKFNSNNTSSLSTIFELIGHYDVDKLPLILIKKMFFLMLSCIMKLFLPNGLHCYLYKVLKILYLALNCLNVMLKEHISEELECFSNKLLHNIDNTAAFQFGDKETSN